MALYKCDVCIAPTLLTSKRLKTKSANKHFPTMIRLKKENLSHSNIVIMTKSLCQPST